MRKYLLPEGLPFFKANLHCHSTESDGQLTPQEIKAAYQEKGYSVVAFTDHEVLVPHPELNGADFLALNGYEIEVLADTPADLGYKNRKTCHIGLIALQPDNLQQVFFNRQYLSPKMREKHSDLLKKWENTPDTPRYYNGAGVSDLMQTARKEGFFVIHNHPYWSREDLLDIMGYTGMHAFEIYNHLSFTDGYDEYNPALYDAMLRRNKRIYCIASDDNHRTEGQFGGFTMICAEKLDYRTITMALENGHFYASTGPEIKGLWFEDGNIHIRCSPAARIRASFSTRKRIFVEKEHGELTEAVIPVEKDDIYVRLTVWDENGNHADTNPYFTENLFE